MKKHFIAALLLLVSMSAFAGGTQQRDLDDWAGANGFVVFNWITEGAVDGLLAVVSRDDFLAPQAGFDSSVIMLDGSIREKELNDGSSRVVATLHYDFLPLEVWTIDENGFLGDLILDDGIMSATFVVKGTLDVAGDVNIIQNINFKHLTFTGTGTALGTGNGDFAVGEQVNVHITQVGQLMSPANPNSAVGEDAFPVENITLH